MCVCLKVYTYERRCLQRPEKGVGSPGIGATGGEESFDVGAGNLT